MKPGVLAGLVAVAVATTAGSVAMSSRVLRPPLAFQANNWAIVEWVDYGQVDTRCQELGAVRGPSERIQACTKGRYIIRPNPCPLSGYSADLDCHEMAHVNGWRHK